MKYIKKRLLDGGIIFLITAISLFLVISGLEAIGRFDSVIRTILFIGFLLISGSLFFIRVVRPLYLLFRAEDAVVDEDAALEIGTHFPSIADKLLNFIQLSSKNFSGNSLANASLIQRANEMDNYNFVEAVSFENEKRKVIRYFIPLILLIILLIILFPRDFIGSSERVVNFNRTYVPQAPFEFKVQKNLIAFRNEDFLLTLTLSGEAIPNEAYFMANGKKTKMATAGVGVFELLFPNITSSKTFTIEAASYNSNSYTIEVVDRPSLSQFQVSLRYPAYLQIPNETFKNVGSFEVPEGTNVIWLLDTRFSERLVAIFDTDTLQVQATDDQEYKLNRLILKDQAYGLNLINKYGQQLGSIAYDIKVIKDQPPQIDIKMLADTVLFEYIVLAGNASDDHGLRNLTLHYSKNKDITGSINLGVDAGATTQSIFYQWLLDTLNPAPGDQLSFYLQVVDNDAVNKYKSVKSKQFYLNIPNKTEAEEKLENSKTQAKEQISETAEQARELKKNIDKLTEDLKGKKELSWQEKQLLENLVEQKEKLNDEIEKVQQENKMLKEQEQKFSEQSKEIGEKQDQLQQLLDELMDEETKQLYDQLQKLLEEYENTESVQQLLEKIQNKELNLEQELERALEFFKQIQYEQKLEEAASDLDNLIEEQESLSDKTSDPKQPLDSLAQEQGKLNEKFNEFQETLQDAKELNQELKRPNSMEDTSGEEEQINSDQKDAKENLEKNNRNKSKQSQNTATEKMKQTAKKIDNMQSSMQMQQMQEDLGDLQSILNNLIELSFDQEDLMKRFREVNQSDPAFITLSQEQLSLKEDSKIINDSLLALSSRVMAISSFVTRELNEMNQQMDVSIEAIRARNKAEASVSQQLTMTSVNNLALMLDNVMRQMQENMANAMGKGKKKEGNERMPGLSEMQEQLNQQIQELSQSGKSGRQLSEELAKLAAEQERIRKALEEAEKKYGGDSGEMKSLTDQMEQTEIDLVNKNLSQQTIRRQNQILTRMLEAEKSMRERELDSQREAKSASQYEKMVPKAFEDYFKQREKEIELLKTVPPKLVPFFKIEVGDYFERVKNQNNSINN